MANRDILALGTSAGGVQALRFLAKHFHPQFPASVLVTIHVPSDAHSALDEVLNGAGPLHAQFATDGDVLKKSRIYIAPPNRHLIVDGLRLALGEGARENNARPAIDPMLRSAAVCCGARTVGVVLTGTLGDGASGLWSVKQAGGISVVQDPADAEFSEMPLTALNRAEPDHIVRLADMPALLNGLAHQQAGEGKPVPTSLEFEVEPFGSGVSGLRRCDVGNQRRPTVAFSLPRRSHLYSRSDEPCARRKLAPGACNRRTRSRGARSAGTQAQPAIVGRGPSDARRDMGR